MKVIHNNSNNIFEVRLDLTLEASRDRGDFWL